MTSPWEVTKIKSSSVMHEKCCPDERLAVLYLQQMGRGRTKRIDPEALRIHWVSQGDMSSYPFSKLELGKYSESQDKSMFQILALFISILEDRRCHHLVMWKGQVRVATAVLSLLLDSLWSRVCMLGNSHWRHFVRVGLFLFVSLSICFGAQSDIIGLRTQCMYME